MEIDPDVLSEVLESDTGIWENLELLDNEISRSENRIKELEEERTTLQSNLETVRSLWTSLKPQSQKIESLSAELEKMNQELSKQDPEITRFFEENTGTLKVFTDKCLIDRVLTLSSIAMDDRSNPDFEELVQECTETGFVHLTERMQKRCDQASMSRKKDLYTDVEKKIQAFAVTNQKSLRSIFLNETSPAAIKAVEFRKLVDVVREQDSRNWQQNLCQIAQKVFAGHLVYHAQMSKVESVVSYVSLVIGLLRSTLQSIYLVMSYPETVARDFSFYDEMSSALMDIAINEVLAKNNGTLDFYRMLMEQSVALDSWVASAELSSTKGLTDRLFEQIGKEWIRVETETMSGVCQAALSSDKDFSLAICTALSSIGDAATQGLSQENKERFILQCLVPAERTTTNALSKFIERDGVTLEQTCWTINCMGLLSTQLMEIYELCDGMYNDLSDDASAVLKRCHALCNKTAQSVFNTFERSAANYLLAQSIPWRNGSPTPSLATALVAVSAQLDIVKQNLDPTIYVNHFITVLGKSVDSKVYYMLLKRFSWSQPKAIDQFSVDLNAMISVFGGDELRLLRSARVILTQKEEKLNYELPEEDVEHFIISKSSI